MDVIRGKFPNSSVHPSLCSLQTLNVFFSFLFFHLIHFKYNIETKALGNNREESICLFTSFISVLRFICQVLIYYAPCVCAQGEKITRSPKDSTSPPGRVCVCVCVLPPLLHLPSFPSSFEWKKKKNEHPPLHSDLLYYDMLCYSLKSCLTAGYRSGGSFIPGPLL